METETFTLFYYVMKQRKASNHSYVIISSYFLLCELCWTHFSSAWHLPVIILCSPTPSLVHNGSVCVRLCLFAEGEIWEKPQLMEGQSARDGMSLLIQAISAKTKQTRRVKIILSGR